MTHDCCIDFLRFRQKALPQTTSALSMLTVLQCAYICCEAHSSTRASLSVMAGCNADPSKTPLQVLITGKISQAVVVAAAAYRTEAEFRERTGMKQTKLIIDELHTNTHVSLDTLYKHLLPCKTYSTGHIYARMTAVQACLRPAPIGMGTSIMIQ